MNSHADITAMLCDWYEGDREVLDELLPAVEFELRRLARSQMRRFRPGGVFQTTALINEAYIRLADQQVQWKNRSHFFAIASTMMRRILVNYIRDTKRQKRGQGAVHVTLGDLSIMTAEKSKEVLALDEALIELAKIDRRRALVVEMKYFGGMTTDEIAEALGISKITVGRDWSHARAWLARFLLNEHIPTI